MDVIELMEDTGGLMNNPQSPKVLEFIKSFFATKKKSFVTIDEFGASTFDVQAFLHTPEGKKMLDDMHEFFEKNKGKSFYD